LIDWRAMSSNWQPKRLAFISAILLLNIAGFFYYIYFFTEKGYLSSPFIYDKSNTFMDLFNVVYWAYDDGRYTDWGSVYPPLSFIILRFFYFVFAGAGFGDPELMRENSQFVIVGMCLFYLAVPAMILSTKYWQEFPKIEKILIYFVIVLSSPMLFTLERGNLILITPVLLALALSKIGIARSLSIALLINIKPYFAILMIYYIAKKNWKGFATCSVLSSLIFAISGLALDNNFLVFFTNLFGFSRNAELFSLREVMALPSSISAFSYILKHPDGAAFVSDFLSSESTAMIIYLIEAAKWSALALSLAALFMRSRQMRDAEVFVLLVVVITNLDTWVGGYTCIFYIALIPVVIKMRAKFQYITLTSIMAMPLDIIPLWGNYIGMKYSYLAADHIEILWTIGMGSIIRPIANFVLLLLLSYEFFARKSENISNNTARHNSVPDSNGLIEKR
jgi:hypothetical protein